MSNPMKDIQSYLDRRESVDWMQGTIMSVNGNTAYVKINGSERFQEANMPQNSTLAAGDVCMMVRTNQNSKWVIISGYGSNNKGSGDVVVTPRGYAKGEYNGDISSYSAWSQLISMQIAKASSTAFIVLVADITIQKPNSAPPYIFGFNFRVKVNGVEKVFQTTNTTYGGYLYGLSAYLSINQIYNDLAAGTHIISIDTLVSGGGASSTATIAAYAYEV